MGKVAIINIQEIPDKLFIQAIKTREIAKARPMSKDEKKKMQRGAPDIIVRPLIGKAYLASRDDIVGHYSYIDGKNIKPVSWSYKKDYLVTRDDDTMVMALKVPLGNAVRVNNKIANGRRKVSGDYIVCLINQDGTINRESASIINSELFKKMCYIPIQEVIQKNKGKHSSQFNFVGLVKRKSRKVQNNSFGFNNSDNVAPKSNKVQVTKTKVQVQKPQGVFVSKNDDEIENMISSYNKSKIPSGYEIVQQIHNSYGKRVGYTIKNGSGQTKDVDTNTAIKLTSSGKIVNADFVNDPGKNPYIRGKGFKLEDLPIKYI